MEPTLGIDFGTTNSAMAWCDPNNGQVRVLRNAKGEEKTLSAVYFGASEVVVGKPALHVLEDAEESRRVVLSCKRYLQSNAVRALPGRRVTLEDIIDQARQLPRQDQRRLLKELEKLLDQENAVEESLIPNESYSKSLELAGAFRMADSNKRGK